MGKAKSMDVVATRRGKYKSVRDRGAEFTLDDGDNDFSEAWMVKAGSKEAKDILRETRDPVSALTAAQIALEEAAATGRPAKDVSEGEKDAEIADLKARLIAAEAAISANGNKGQPGATNVQDVTLPSEMVGTASAENNKTSDDANEDEGTAKPKRRPTRRAK